MQYDNSTIDVIGTMDDGIIYPEAS